MQPRKDHETASINLPESWTQEVKKLLLQNYQEHCDTHGKTFEVYGETYPSEVLIAVSFLNKADQLIIPVTYMISANLEKTQNQEELLKSLIDTIGLYFDTYFSNPESEDGIYVSNWEDAEFNKVNFWYKVTRENIGLSILADDLLK